MELSKGEGFFTSRPLVSRTGHPRDGGPGHQRQDVQIDKAAQRVPMYLELQGAAPSFSERKATPATRTSLTSSAWWPPADWI
jgi:hypothetical protein